MLAYQRFRVNAGAALAESCENLFEDEVARFETLPFDKALVEACELQRAVLGHRIAGERKDLRRLRDRPCRGGWKSGDLEAAEPALRTRCGGLLKLGATVPTYLTLDHEEKEDADSRERAPRRGLRVWHDGPVRCDALPAAFGDLAMNRSVFVSYATRDLVRARVQSQLDATLERSAASRLLVLVLESHRKAWALVGGAPRAWATGVGEPNDLDIVVGGTRGEVDRVVAAWESRLPGATVERTKLGVPPQVTRLRPGRVGGSGHGGNRARTVSRTQSATEPSRSLLRFRSTLSC